MILQAKAGTFARPNGRTIFRDVAFELAGGDVMCVLGPNGVGKTTLLRCLAGLERLRTGSILLDGQDIAQLTRRRIGQLVGMVPQSDAPVFSFSVRQMVEMGRAAHLGWLAAPGARDRDIAGAAMDRLGIAALAERAYPELSGGERQLVLIARALAQQTRVLILDEPTAHLDFANQAQVLDLAKELAGERLAVVLTTHNPDHAFHLGAKALLMARDGTAVFGPTEAVLTQASLSAAYGRMVDLLRAEGRTFCFAHGRRQGATRLATRTRRRERRCVLMQKARSRVGA